MIKVPKQVTYEAMDGQRKREQLEVLYCKMLAKARRQETTPEELAELTQACFNIEQIFDMWQRHKGR